MGCFGIAGSQAAKPLEMAKEASCFVASSLNLGAQSRLTAPEGFVLNSAFLFGQLPVPAATGAGHQPVMEGGGFVAAYVCYAA